METGLNIKPKPVTDSVTKVDVVAVIRSGSTVFNFLDGVFYFCTSSSIFGLYLCKKVINSLILLIDLLKLLVSFCSFSFFSSITTTDACGAEEDYNLVVIYLAKNTFAIVLNKLSKI